ncbi:uncharacterized protein [Dermacentor andersoni]|uniref:uncharacterized protein isoform X2 n=1 Tax=Dermacentor andersoni TaxID=34620 RepID=UPI002155EF01|nr:uncharacterized protein LOC126544444 isoform X2 [Dermacentor andersoni]
MQDYGMWSTKPLRTEEEEREYKRRRAEAARRRRQNLSEEQKAAERERNAAAARERRLHQTEEQRAAERERHRARRANPQVRAAERARDAEARRKRRANPHLRAAERTRRRERRLAEGIRPTMSRRQRRAKAAAARRDRRLTADRRQASASPSPPSAAVARAAENDDDSGCDFVLDDFGQLCSACDRLCFRQDVCKVSPLHVRLLGCEFPDENVADFVLCKACRDSLEAGNVSSLSRRNGNACPQMPEWLTILSSDEEEQLASCAVHGPVPLLSAKGVQTEVVMPLSRRANMAIGSSWIDDGVSRSTQTPTSLSAAAKVHSWTAMETDDPGSLPQRRRSLRKRAR